MARILPGPLISDIRGTAGGLVYSANANGKYVRIKSTPPRVSIASQEGTRSSWMEATSRWTGLSSVARGNWNAFAADTPQVQYDVFGDSFFLPGISWFRKINIWRDTVGRAMTSTVPSAGKPAMPTISSLLITVGATKQALVSYPSGMFSGYDMVIRCGLRPRASNLTQIASPVLIYTSTSPGATSVDVFSELEDVYGKIQAGQRFIFEVHRQSTEGYRGTAAQISGVVETV